MSIYLCSLWSSVSRFWSVISLVFGLSWHCQISITFHPNSARREYVILSRSTFPEILDSQNSRFVSGIVAYLQPGWPCQKQPLIKMAVLYFGRTMSGFPVKSLRCSRNRKLFANKKRRTKTSGLVSLLRMCDIHLRRCSFDNTSAIIKQKLPGSADRRPNLCATTRKFR